MRVRGYAAGAPCWAEVASDDAAATRTFYGALFGWGFAQDRFTLDGRAVAGLRERGSGPAAWLVSISTDDCAATARAVESAGGAVRMPPSPVGTEGVAGLFSDPSGAVFGTWQRGVFFGAQLTFELGAICWYELSAHDISAAGEFYGRVFGWRVFESPNTPGEPYFEFHHDEDSVAGLVPIDRRFPSPEVPPHWTACFMVNDCHSTCDRILELGGAVARKPIAMPAGWYARVADPQGSHFAVIELSDELAPSR